VVESGGDGSVWVGKAVAAVVVAVVGEMLVRAESLVWSVWREIPDWK